MMRVTRQTRAADMSCDSVNFRAFQPSRRASASICIRIRIPRIRHPHRLTSTFYFNLNSQLNFPPPCHPHTTLTPPDDNTRRCPDKPRYEAGEGVCWAMAAAARFAAVSMKAVCAKKSGVVAGRETLT